MDQDATTILLACLSYESDKAKKERLAYISAQEWQAVAALAQRHAVAPFLYHHLNQLGVDVPDDIIKGLRQASLKNTSRNLRIYKELGDLLSKLREINIPVIVLKGAHLAEIIYTNKGLRYMVDIDLLVLKDDLLRVEKVLMRMGYGIDDQDTENGMNKVHLIYRHPNNDFHFEIHWALYETEDPFQIDIPGLWTRAEPVVLAQAPALALSPNDLLVFLCVHAIHHLFWIRISMICDIGEVVRQKGMELDWQLIAARARQWGALCSIYFILRLAKDLLGVAVPADWLASIQPDDFEEDYLILGRQRIFHRDWFDEDLISSTNVTRLWDLKGLSSKLALIRSRLLPSRRSMAEMYQANANSWRIYLYYPVRWKDVLARNWMTFSRLMRGDRKTQSEAVHANEINTLREWVRSR